MANYSGQVVIEEEDGIPIDTGFATLLSSTSAYGISDWQGVVRKAKGNFTPALLNRRDPFVLRTSKKRRAHAIMTNVTGPATITVTGSAGDAPPF